VRTAVALAALSAEGPTTIESPPGFRDHTERWLEAMGLGERTGESGFVVHPGPVPCLELTVPGDTSSAAYLWVAAAVFPGSSVTTPGVSLNPGRTGLLTVLERMGARVEVEHTGELLGDPWGTVTVGAAPMQGIEVSGALTASCLDELPLVAVLGSIAEGTTLVRDAAELRVKESDRIASTVRFLNNMGGSAEETEDGFVVRQSRLPGGRVDPQGDHRIAMAAAVASVVSPAQTFIHALPAAADVSWPGFVDHLEALWS
jgi:3-phosphoshikimate 1-carboxyvinyltransferase